MAELEQIVAKFVADTRAYTEGVDKVRKQTRETAAEGVSAFERLSRTIRTAFTGAVFGFSLAKLRELTVSTLAWAHDLTNLATRLGTTRTSLQELTFAGREFGLTTQQLEAGLRLFTLRLSEAASGRGEHAAIFKQLGVSVRDARGNVLGLDEVLNQVANRLREFDQPGQLAIAKNLFGDEHAARFVALLGQGKSKLDELREAARSSGAVIRDEVLARAVDMHRELDKMTTAAGQDLRKALVDLGPVILFLTGLARGLSSAIRQVVTGVTADDLQRRIERFERELHKYPETRPKARGVLPEIYGNLTPTRADIQREIERLRAQRLELLRTDPDRVSAGEAMGPAMVPPPETKKSAGKKFVDPRGAGGGGGLAEFEQKIREVRAELTALENELRFDRPTAEFLKLVEAFAAGDGKLKPTADQVKRFREEAERVKETKLQLVVREYAQETANLVKQTEAEASWNARVARVMKEKIELEKQLGAEYARTHPDIIGQLAEERVAAEETLEATRRRMENLRDAASEFGKTFGSAFTDAALEGKKLDEVVNQLTRDLARMFAQRFIFGPLFDGPGGGFFGNIVGKLLGSIFPSERGNVFSGPVRPHARGGLVSGPLTFPMGDGRLGTMAERRPEAIFPIVRTSTGDLGVRAVGSGSGGSGGALTVNVVNNTSARARAETGPSGDLMIVLDQANEQLIGRSGSRTSQALRQRFGAVPQTVAR